VKITKDDYATLCNYLDKVVAATTAESLASYVAQLRHDPKVRDLSKRLRWDLLHASRLRIGDGKGMSGDIALYAYMDDTHIDTALRQYMADRGLDKLTKEAAK
jgi:hypothetical protein